MYKRQGTLHVPRLKGVSFETAIIERYRRRESSVEEALIEIYLAVGSVRRVEYITEALWGSKVSPATISEPVSYTHLDLLTIRGKAAVVHDYNRSLTGINPICHTDICLLYTSQPPQYGDTAEMADGTDG